MDQPTPDQPTPDLSAPDLSAVLERLWSRHLGLWDEPAAYYHLYRTSDGHIHTSELSIPEELRAQPHGFVLGLLCQAMEFTEPPFSNIRASLIPPPGYYATVAVNSVRVSEMPPGVAAQLAPRTTRPERVLTLAHCAPGANPGLFLHHPDWDAPVEIFTPHTPTDHPEYPPTLNLLAAFAQACHTALTEDPGPGPRTSMLDLRYAHGLARALLERGEACGVYQLLADAGVDGAKYGLIFGTEEEPLTRSYVMSFLRQCESKAKDPEYGAAVAEVTDPNRFEGLAFIFHTPHMMEFENDSLLILREAGLVPDPGALQDDLEQTLGNDVCIMVALSDGRVYYTRADQALGSVTTASQHDPLVLVTRNDHTTLLTDPTSSDDTSLADGNTVGDYLQAIYAALAAHLPPYDPDQLPTATPDTAHPGEPLTFDHAHEACMAIADTGHHGLFLIYRDGTNTECVGANDLLQDGPDLSSALETIAAQARTASHPGQLPATTRRPGSTFAGAAIVALSRAVSTETGDILRQAPERSPREMCELLKTVPGSPLNLSVNLLTTEGDHYLHIHSPATAVDADGASLTVHSGHKDYILTNRQGTFRAQGVDSALLPGGMGMFIGPNISLGEPFTDAVTALADLHQRTTD